MNQPNTSVNPNQNTAANQQKIIQQDRNNRYFYRDKNNLATFCDAYGNPLEYDRTGHQVFYDAKGYPFYYDADGFSSAYDFEQVKRDQYGYVIVSNLCAEGDSAFADSLNIYPGNCMESTKESKENPGYSAQGGYPYSNSYIETPMNPNGIGNHQYPETPKVSANQNFEANAREIYPNDLYQNNETAEFKNPHPSLGIEPENPYGVISAPATYGQNNLHLNESMTAPASTAEENEIAEKSLNESEKDNQGLKSKANGKKSAGKEDKKKSKELRKQEKEKEKYNKQKAKNLKKNELEQAKSLKKEHALSASAEEEKSSMKEKMSSMFSRKGKSKKEIYSSIDVDGSSDALLSDVIQTMSDEHKHPEKALAKMKNERESRKTKAAMKKSSKALKKKAGMLKVPKTVQDSIPYLAVYPDDGIFELEEGVYSKSYLLSDVNYSIAKQQEQEQMFISYGEFLNSHDTSQRIQITINQRSLNMDEFKRDVLLNPKNNKKLDSLIAEHNDMLLSKMEEGKNNLVIEKYATITVKAADINQARNVFSRYDNEIASNMKKIGDAQVRALSAAERLEILHDIYNQDSVGFFGNNRIKNEKGEYVFHPDEKFSFAIMNRMGLNTKDCIGPESFEFKTDYGKIGDKYFRALFLKSIPNFMGDTLIKDLSETECNMITSIHYEPVEAEKAIQMANHQVTSIRANVIDKQKQASRGGYDPSLISPALQSAQQEANELVMDLTRKNQKLFFMTFMIAHFADTKEQLDSDTESIKQIGRRFVCDIRPLKMQMEYGLQTALPLGTVKVELKRSLTTESAAIFMPFVNQELIDRNGGIYYANNAISGNLILLDRRKCKNGNGFIFGLPGSGKSMMAKQEMLTVLLSSNDDVIVIDPEGEYKPMAQILGGEVIKIAAGEKNHLNPFDINLDIDDADDPIATKSDFIVSLCDVIAGSNIGLSPTQRSIIDRCVQQVYKPLINSRDPKTGKYNYELTPTLKDFWKALKAQPGFEAMQLADSLEIYVEGSLQVFAHKTNVKYHERFVVYDIQEIGSTMKTMGLLVVLDNIWNRIVEGREQGKHVWFFIDEIYLLFQNISSAEFLKNLYKRARKYGGIPTGITQNVSDILDNPIAKTMIANSEYILMMSQSQLDRVHLGELLRISPTQMDYITNSDSGVGLLYDGVHIIPFVNKVPRDSIAYHAMTTKLEETVGREEKLKAAEAERLQIMLEKGEITQEVSKETEENTE